MSTQGERKAPLLPSADPPAAASKSAEPFKALATPPLWVLLNPLAWLLWLLDFVVFLIISPIYIVKAVASMGMSSVAVDAAEQGYRRHPTSVGGLSTSSDSEIRTVYELMQRAFATYKGLPALGTRTYLGEHKKEGVRFPLKKFGKTNWATYGDVQANTAAFGRGLRQLGLEPLPRGVAVEDVSNGPHTLLIYEDTSEEWTTAVIGAISQSIVVATSYATLGISSVADAVNDSNVRVVLCNRNAVAKVIGLASGCPSLTTIIYTDHYVTPEEVAAGPPAVDAGALKVISYAEVLAEGGKSDQAPTPPEESSVAVIMYTSGSTGKPKGVMLKHSHVLAAVSGVRNVIKDLLPPGKGAYLSYLPAAHIFEFMAEMFYLSYGYALGFADPKTLSSTGAVRVRDDGTISDEAGFPFPPGAIQEFAPRTMVGVPKIWDILKKGVEAKIGDSSVVVQFLFLVAFAGRAAALRQGREAPLLKLIFGKVRAMLGGNLELAVSGGGALSSEVQTFVRTVFCCPMIQGYALTETCAGATVQTADDPRDGVVGPPLNSTEIRLRSCPEVLDVEGKPYLATDTAHRGDACLGRGEVLIGGPCVSAGYYLLPEKTAEAYKEGGWFHSGDIGLWTPDGSLKIVDRLKNLVKLKGGEYVALENMEKEYSNSVYVDGVGGGVMCYGDADMDRPVALCIAKVGECIKWARANDVAYETPEALMANEALQKEVLDSFVKAGKKGNLGANEIVVAVGLLPGTGEGQDPESVQPNDPWTPQNGMLTASNKLNRKPIEKAYKAVLDPLKAKGIRG